MSEYKGGWCSLARTGPRWDLRGCCHESSGSALNDDRRNWWRLLNDPDRDVSAKEEEKKQQVVAVVAVMAGVVHRCGSHSCWGDVWQCRIRFYG